MYRVYLEIYTQQWFSLALKFCAHRPAAAATGKSTVAGHAAECLHRLGLRPRRHAVSSIFKSEQQCDQRIIFKYMGGRPADVNALWQTLPQQRDRPAGAVAGHASERLHWPPDTPPMLLNRILCTAAKLVKTLRGMPGHCRFPCGRGGWLVCTSCAQGLTVMPTTGERAFIFFLSIHSIFKVSNF
jgi:hypothetical protein